MEAKDHFSVQFDDNPPTVWTDIYKLSSSLFVVSCGSPVKKCLSTSIVGKRFHTLSSVTIKVSWSFQGNPSAAFGIKDLSLSFGKKTPNDVEEMYMTLGDSSLSWSTNCPGQVVITIQQQNPVARVIHCVHYVLDHLLPNATLLPGVHRIAVLLLLVVLPLAITAGDQLSTNAIGAAMYLIMTTLVRLVAHLPILHLVMQSRSALNHVHPLNI